jgi:hypothetical protein
MASVHAWKALVDVKFFVVAAPKAVSASFQRSIRSNQTAWISGFKEFVAVCSE